MKNNHAPMPTDAHAGEREALARIIQRNLDISMHPDSMGEPPEPDDMCPGCLSLADVILFAGYRRGESGVPSSQNAAAASLAQTEELIALLVWCRNVVDSMEPEGWRVLLADIDRAVTNLAASRGPKSHTPQAWWDRWFENPEAEKALRVMIVRGISDTLGGHWTEKKWVRADIEDFIEAVKAGEGTDRGSALIAFLAACAPNATPSPTGGHP